MVDLCWLENVCILQMSARALVASMTLNYLT